MPPQQESCQPRVRPLENIITTNRFLQSEVESIVISKLHYTKVPSKACFKGHGYHWRHRQRHLFRSRELKATEPSDMPNVVRVEESEIGRDITIQTRRMPVLVRNRRCQTGLFMHHGSKRRTPLQEWMLTDFYTPENCPTSI